MQKIDHKARLAAARRSLAKLMNQYEDKQDVLANRLDQQREINLSIMARLAKLEHKSSPQTDQYVLIHGNPVDGCEYYGPFTSTEEADELGDKLQGDWWITKLVNTKE